MAICLILSLAFVFLAVPTVAQVPASRDQADSAVEASLASVFAGLTSSTDGWASVEGSPLLSVLDKPLDGLRGLRLPCDMTGDHRRAAWDRNLDVDLSRMDRFSFWLYVDDPTKLADYYTFYFGAGDGWYGASFSTDKGWQKILLDKSAFRSEGKPSGWDHVRSLRISAWKSKDSTTFMALSDMQAITTPVVVVTSDPPGTERQAARTQAALMLKVLERIGVGGGALTDADVETGGLVGRRVAILAYNPAMTEKELSALESFLNAGGKLIAFYMIPDRLLDALGLVPTKWQTEAYQGQFSSIRLKSDVVPGMPASVRQASWNINGVRAAGKGASIVGEWCDAKGLPTGLPALAVSDTGAFMTHVLLADDIEGKDRVMLALLGKFMPEIWENAARTALEDSACVGEFHSVAETAAFIRKSDRAPAVTSLEQAEQQLSLAQKCVEAKQYPQAVELANSGRQDLVRAYCAAQSPRSPEMRGVWCHSAFGIPGLTWDQAMAGLANNGLNTLFVNMLWGGCAFYPSKVLPVDERVKKDGDQIALCMTAARKHGIRLNIWKVDWNLATAPRDFLEKMRAAKRTQKDPEGADIDWLCPSNPANFELERNSLLEVVRKYDVDGIHFDYIRYPGREGCYCDGCRVRFQQQFGVTVANWPKDVIDGALKEKYLDFRRSNITRLVRTVSEEARKLKPQIRISAAVFADWPQCRDDVGQDWVEWVKQGYLDFVCPMDYTNRPKQLGSWVSNQLTATNHAVPVYPGIGVTLGDYNLSPDQVAHQINMTRQLGADGFVLFNYGSLLLAETLPALRDGVSRDK